MRDYLLKSLSILLLFLLFYGEGCAQEMLSIGHVFKKETGLEEITASLYSQQADTVNFTLYCQPQNGRIEYHKIPIRNKHALTNSGIQCPQKVVVKAETMYSTQYDTLNVALIRKINRCRDGNCDDEEQTSSPGKHK